MKVKQLYVLLASLCVLLTWRCAAAQGTHEHAETSDMPEIHEPTATSNGHKITVYKSPYCGCCRQWIQHLQGHGFLVESIDSDDMNTIKDEYGVPKKLASCHTARVDGYTIEGHVPAKDILTLLTERPRADGLTVPGMPVGSPGMESGDRVDPYTVFLFTGDDKQAYAAYPQQDASADLPVVSDIVSAIE